MKKNIKAIIAALSASIMCAVPVAASFANTTAVTSITAEAAADIIHDATLIAGDNIVIAKGALTYQINGSEASLYGRYNQVSDVIMPDKLRYNGTIYKITSVRPEAFKNACTTATGSGVRRFRCGKYVRIIGDRAFMGSSVYDVDLSGAASLTTIGNDAFACASVGTSLTIPASVTLIRSGAFRDNRWLNTIEFSSSSRYLTISSRAFANLTNLTAIEADRIYYSSSSASNAFAGVNPSFDPYNDITGAGKTRFISIFFPGYPNPNPTR